MQVGEDPRYILVAITIKHMVANSVEGEWSPDGQTYGGPTATIGRHTVDANISRHDLADVYWPGFRDSIREGNAQGVMCSYNSVNGVPTCLDPLHEAARKQWGFTGYVTSDTDAVDDAYSTHHFSSSLEAASCTIIPY